MFYVVLLYMHCSRVEYGNYEWPNALAQKKRSRRALSATGWSQMYIYIYIERERYIYIYVYVYIYIYIYTLSRGGLSAAGRSREMGHA